MDKTTALAIVDAVASTVALLATNFISPKDADLVIKLVVLWQPMAGALLWVWLQQAKLAADAVAQAQNRASEEKTAALYRQAETK